MTCQCQIKCSAGQSPQIKSYTFLLDDISLAEYMHMYMLAKRITLPKLYHLKPFSTTENVYHFVTP